MISHFNNLSVNIHYFDIFCEICGPNKDINETFIEDVDKHFEGFIQYYAE